MVTQAHPKTLPHPDPPRRQRHDQPPKEHPGLQEAPRAPVAVHPEVPTGVEEAPRAKGKTKPASGKHKARKSA